jgi:hypothetical protein
MINENDNTLEGSRYRQPWYISSRLIDTDKFWVQATGPGTADADQGKSLGPVGRGVEP